jgi:hypothetical protein
LLRTADKQRVSRGSYLALMLAIAGWQTGCSNGSRPEQVADKFLREVKRENWKTAWSYLSGPSQQKMRADSERMIAGAPYYVTEFQPERLACSRFESMVPGSAKVQTVEGTNAALAVQRKVPTGFALPGFSPMGRKKVPDEMFLVQENGAWKIDLVRPTSAEAAALAARQRAIQRELDAVNAYRATNRF